MNKVIDAKDWAQTNTAKVLGISKPDVSKLSRGRFQFLSRLERRVTITVSSDTENVPREEIIIPQQRVSSEARISKTL